MDIKLIIPFESLESNISSAETFKVQQLNFPLLAAFTPVEHNIKIVDESFIPDNIEENVDLVGITVMTELVLRAYQIADNYRQRGVKVVMGGIHTSVVPDEALKHADAVVVGEGEEMWPQVIADVEHNRLQKVYLAKKKSDLAGRPLPRYDLYPEPSSRGYTPMVVGVETSRGCPFDCEFCATGQVMGRKYRIRPIHEIIYELDSIEKSIILFVDDNLGLDRTVGKKIFTEMIPLKKKWIGEGTVALAEDPELLRVMKRSGCEGLLIGFESVNRETQSEMLKFKKMKMDYGEAIHRFHSEGIPVLGAFIFGFDNENKDIFDQTIEFALSLKLDFAQFKPLTPYPGTRLYHRLLKEGRLLVPDWWLTRYKSNALLYHPKNMTPDEFYEGMERVKKQFFSIGGIVNRFFGISPWNRSAIGWSVYLATNLANRKRYYRGFRT